jgi:hypothetical protein
MPRARPAQRGGGRGRDVEHLVVGMEGGEVQGHVGAEFLARSIRVRALISASESFRPGMSRVVISNQVFVSTHEVDQRVQHGLQVAGAVSFQ